VTGGILNSFSAAGQRRAAGIAFLLAIHLSRVVAAALALTRRSRSAHRRLPPLNLVEVLSPYAEPAANVIIAWKIPLLRTSCAGGLRSTAVEVAEASSSARLRTASGPAIKRQADIFPLRRETCKPRKRPDGPCRSSISLRLLQSSASQVRRRQSGHRCVGVRRTQTR